MIDEEIDYEDLDDLPISEHIEWNYLFLEDDHEGLSDMEWLAG